jgi:hypothetical protein
LPTPTEAKGSNEQASKAREQNIQRTHSTRFFLPPKTQKNISLSHAYSATRPLRFLIIEKEKYLDTLIIVTPPIPSRIYIKCLNQRALPPQHREFHSFIL